MLLTKLKYVALVVLAFMLLGGVGTWLGFSSPEDQPKEPGKSSQAPQKEIVPKVRDDVQGKESSDDVVRLGASALRFKEGVSGVAFLGDGKLFAVLAKNRIRIFETATAKQVRAWSADKQVLHAIAATADGKLIASAGNEMIRLWKADTGKMIREFNKHVGKRVARLDYSPDGKYLLSYGEERDPRDGDLKGKGLDDWGWRVWDVATGTEVPSFKIPIHGVSIFGDGPIEFTPDSKKLVWRDSGKFHIRPLDGTADQTQSFDASDKTKWVMPFAYRISGGVLGSDVLEVWDGNKERNVVHFKPDYKFPPVRAAYPCFDRFCFSHDHKYVASAGYYQGIDLWELAKETHRLLVPGQGPNNRGSSNGLDFSRDGKALIACSGNEIRWFDLANGQGP